MIEKDSSVMWSGGHGKLGRVIVIVGGSMGVVAGVYLVLMWISGAGSGTRHLVLGAVSLLLGAYSFLSVFRFRILITTTFLEKRDIKTTRIHFTNVKRLRLFEDRVQVEGSNTTIRLPRDMAGRDALDVLIPFLRRYHHISITGDDTLLEKYKLGKFR